MYDSYPLSINAVSLSLSTLVPLQYSAMYDSYPLSINTVSLSLSTLVPLQYSAMYDSYPLSIMQHISICRPEHKQQNTIIKINTDMESRTYYCKAVKQYTYINELIQFLSLWSFVDCGFSVSVSSRVRVSVSFFLHFSLSCVG